MAGELTANLDRVFKTLLILDSLRGEDSTGALLVSRFTGKPTVAKQLGDPFCLFNDSKFDIAFRTINRVMLGHNRFATSGGVSKVSAHPFENDSLIGVHNGTLLNKHKLVDSGDFKVDSENLYHHIDKLGLESALQVMEGAWALVWWDKKEETLNFLRNAERPLWLCRSENGKAIFWASEKWMLEIALSREGIKRGDIFSLDTDLLHTIKIDNQGAMSKPTVRPAAAPERIENQVNNLYNWPKRVGYSGGTNTRSVVIVPEKKTEIVVGKESSTSLSGVDSKYLQSRDVMLETLGLKTDSYGAEYIICFDPKREYYEIRLYLKKNDPLKDLVGEDIIGDISSYVPCSTTPNKGYYKVSPWTVKLAMPVEEVQETLYTTHKGSLVTEKSWKSMYKACVWCSDALNPDHDNRFTTGGDCVCPSCAGVTEVTQYVNLI